MTATDRSHDYHLAELERRLEAWFATASSRRPITETARVRVRITSELLTGWLPG